MNMKEIKEILQLMAEHDLSEFELDRGEFKIKLKKTGSGRIVQEHYSAPAGSLPQAPAAPMIQSSSDRNTPVAASSDEILIKSPMVGTFYASPAPDQPAYISIGSMISEGDVLCIIEAMKLMNEIKSDISGEVTEILVKNGQPIEFDQPLFKLSK